ncbi:hypothetical protein Gasu2_53220 [Galdieria sulphuraria]|uniref:Uncharacterized protein n=1 Tax=Galdieria sulphuraria TaxID=130081 RepID=M2XZ18_GALSU|nr:uncharacterized protein Gasu_37150 [Galdieria sulphuraria]EME28824.1 hypothetical protein Gasu_37150 [Galdieria sulphuraria]GJD11179.1 hypothetical protein Gasu2_53220 [Galdieria sulphuraria]|eukprot:XP_005705344.1 hypothetical protein Gasu_37150 [Galdieria sulphuraria]
MMTRIQYSTWFPCSIGSDSNLYAIVEIERCKLSVIFKEHVKKQLNDIVRLSSNKRKLSRPLDKTNIKSIPSSNRGLKGYFHSYDLN